MSQASPRPTFLQAAGVAAWTGFVFLVVYNACNWITTLRPDVQVAAFGWEHRIPVVPWMIVPYWSLDAFFVAAPFLCRDQTELRVLRRRLVLTTLLAGLCFLIIPLQLAWERPKVEGLYAPLFHAIQGMDKPHNLFPSLHIVLRTVLALHFSRHTSGVWRLLSLVWFSLIGISTLLTWQHHMVDVLGGFVLAAMILHIVPDQPAKAERNIRVGCYYIAAALVLLFLARLLPPWSLILAWPAFSLGTVATGCLGLGASVLHKHNGRLPLLTRLLLVPWLLGQWLSWKHYRKQSALCDRLTERVWIGPLPDEATAQRLLSEGVTHVLDMTAEFDAPESFRALPGYKNIAVADLTAPTPAQMHEAAAFIESAQTQGIVFIHCKAGYSRTAAAAGAWLRQQGCSFEQAIERLRAARPRIVVRPEVVQALRGMQ